MKLKRFLFLATLFVFSNCVSYQPISYEAGEQRTPTTKKAEKSNWDLYVEQHGEPIATSDTIPLRNPSFEGISRCCEAPKGWHDCGVQGETAPDVQPGSFDVKLEAKEGNTYLGMVARDNGTAEAVGCRLLGELKADETYRFSIWLARSPEYLSLSRVNGQEANYSAALHLKVYGGMHKCQRMELLAETAYVQHFDWQLYEMSFTPTKHIDHLVFEVESLLPNSNGNLLLDNCSAIIRIKE